ncbi:leukemia NUP98 fusion partner 1 [Ornithorhynchus anatinus]|uniref:Leukemia NUP98 fusion partner 1 n=1 Tax=Ornithorhynchus anatinus TaxID=9258 RepID=F7CHU6_ORNAN|nr:leukemia NUP98 fusion partner 1 [Ornithorhynchus anatinus]
MEHEDDDDVCFAKWMSSFWGHSWMDEREGRAQRRRRSQSLSDRRASLPSPAQLSVLHTPRLPGSSRAPSSGQLRRHSQEDQEFRSYHPGKTCKTREPQGYDGRSHSIQEFSESFEQQLCVRAKRSVSLEPEGGKARKEREGLRTKTRSHKRVGERKGSKKEEGEASVVFPAKKSDEELSSCMDRVELC